MKNLAGLISLLLFFSCMNNAQTKEDAAKGLKDYYKNFFPVGVSVAPGSLHGDEASLILKHFNSITPENAMKMKPIHPNEHEYHWKEADSIVEFAKKNGLKVRGHALVWHQEIPDWLFENNGKPAAKELVLQRIKDHITTVVKRYKGSVYAWDVVNEAISNDDHTFYRPSKLFEFCGETFIAKAFEWAHAADPDAILFYNDFNEYDVVKRGKIIRMIQQLRDKGVPIQAVGLQAHWSIYEPSKEQLEQTLKDFSALQLPVQITELDISVYPKIEQAGDASVKVMDTNYTAEREKQQVQQYKMCFELFRKYKSTIAGVTFWNISDRHSWLDNFPVKNRKDHPLLFDEQLQPKKAYHQVIAF